MLEKFFMSLGDFVKHQYKLTTRTHVLYVKTYLFSASYVAKSADTAVGFVVISANFFSFLNKYTYM